MTEGFIAQRNLTPIDFSKEAPDLGPKYSSVETAKTRQSRYEAFLRRLEQTPTKRPEGSEGTVLFARKGLIPAETVGAFGMADDPVVVKEIQERRRKKR